MGVKEGRVGMGKEGGCGVRGERVSLGGWEGREGGQGVREDAEGEWRVRETGRIRGRVKLKKLTINKNISLKINIELGYRK